MDNFAEGKLFIVQNASYLGECNGVQAVLVGGLAPRASWVNLNRNAWSACGGMADQEPSQCTANLGRNTQKKRNWIDG